MTSKTPNLDLQYQCINRKMTGNNPKLDFVNINAYTKFGRNLAICPEDIERKQSKDINPGP